MNHYYDADAGATRCREHTDPSAYYVSANGWVSCPDCLGLLTPEELAGERYGVDA